MLLQIFVSLLQIFVLLLNRIFSHTLLKIFVSQIFLMQCLSSFVALRSLAAWPFLSTAQPLFAIHNTKHCTHRAKYTMKYISIQYIVWTITPYNTNSKIQNKIRRNTKYKIQCNTLDRSYPSPLLEVPTVGLNHHCPTTHGNPPLPDILSYMLCIIYYTV